tara:strand:+ start:378 stop:842 length:465 start_codon:yes stop_codon:yes gene_type:complete
MTKDNDLKTRDKILKRINQSSDSIFLLSDFDYLSNRATISRILSSLCEKKYIARISNGIFVKVRKSVVTGNIILDDQLDNLARIALNRLGYETGEAFYQRLYKEGKTSQVPLGLVVGVKGKQPTRKFKFNGYSVNIENITNLDSTYKKRSSRIK